MSFVCEVAMVRGATNYLEIDQSPQPGDQFESFLET